MSNPLPCDNHQAEWAAMLITRLDTGDTMTLCGPCVVEWARMVADIPLEPDAPAPTNGDPTEGVADLEPDGPAPDAKPKRRVKQTPPPEPVPEQIPEPVSEATTASD